MRSRKREGESGEGESQRGGFTGGRQCSIGGSRGHFCEWFHVKVAKGTGRDLLVWAGVIMKSLGGEAHIRKAHLLGRKV